ncbi:MAG: hypothetical protein JXR94_10965 [Candidatus Hydrogenedentes bacterium]|nr:hypothetical protein [Candidatus Hydrogenedentota bacterium]
MSEECACDLCVLGVRIAVRTNRPAIAGAARREFEAFIDEEPAADAVVLGIAVSGHTWRVEVDGRCASLDVQPGDWARVGDLVTLVAAHGRRDLRFVHGSSVATPRGAALFIGPSTSGKTTLALALDRAGFPLLADDITPVDLAAATAFAFPTTAGVRPHTAALLDGHTPLEWPVHDRARGTGGRMGSPVSVGHLFFLEAANGRVKRAPLLDGWERLVAALFGGPSPGRGNAARSVFALRDKSDFAREPELAAFAGVEVARELLRYSYPPRPPLGELLPAAGAFLQRVTCHSLRPGYLDSTVRLIRNALGA